MSAVYLIVTTSVIQSPAIKEIEISNLLIMKDEKSSNYW
jgi:hypothetical protein